MKEKHSALLNSMKTLIAGVSEQVLYYLALFGAIFVGFYFESIPAGVGAAVLGVLIAWTVSGLIDKG